MAKALFITTADLKKFTAVNGNLDPDKFTQFILVAQDTHIQNFLGSDLYEKIEADIIAGTLTGNYATLVSDYLKPMLIQYALLEYLPFAAYTVGNKGVFKHTSEASEGVSKTEIDYLVEKTRDIAEHYTQRFIDYMCNNSNLYPEYNSNSNGDMYPSTKNNFSGWYI